MQKLWPGDSKRKNKSVCKLCFVFPALWEAKALWEEWSSLGFLTSFVKYALKSNAGGWHTSNAWFSCNCKCGYQAAKQTSRFAMRSCQSSEYIAGDLLPRRQGSLYAQLWNILTSNCLVIQSYLCIKAVFKIHFKCSMSKCILAHRFSKN